MNTKKIMTMVEIRDGLMNGKTIFDMELYVTFYARVSTDKYEQKNSLQNQVDYYNNFIKSVPKWHFVPGYIDEGISGTSTNKRDDFKRMIADGKKGLFNLILTKEISRFARDTLDSIQYTRKLLENGVGVFFQTDNINTFSPDSELRLTIMASIAQEEVRKLSERVKFGFQRQINKGSVLGNDSIWGYEKDKTVKKDENKRLVIVEEEAKIIRKIFDMYVNDHIGTRNIGIALAKEGIFNKNGNPFAQGTIKGILTNPKYKGYYCGNKSRVINYHSKQRIFIEEDDWKLYEDKVNVPPIVSEQIWEKAQQILAMRSKQYSHEKTVYQNRYPFSGKIVCMKDNARYSRRLNTSSGITKRQIPTWKCVRTLKSNRECCNSPVLHEEELKEIVGKTIIRYVSNPSLVDDLIAKYKKISKKSDNNKEIENIQNRLAEKEKEKNNAFDLIVKGIINGDDFKNQINAITQEIETLKTKLNELKKDIPILSENNQIERIKKRALEMIEYPTADIDKLIYSFLERIEVDECNCIGNDTIRIRVILTTGNDASIKFKHGSLPFSTSYAYD